MCHQRMAPAHVFGMNQPSVLFKPAELENLSSAGDIVYAVRAQARCSAASALNGRLTKAGIRFLKSAIALISSMLFNVPKVFCLALIIVAISPGIRVRPSFLSPLTKGIQPRLVILWSCFHVFRRFPLATTCLCVVVVYSTFRILHLEPRLFGSLRLPFLHPC